MAFIAPFAASASIDEDNEEWLNLLWERMTEESGPNRTNKCFRWGFQTARYAVY